MGSDFDNFDNSKITSTPKRFLKLSKPDPIKKRRAGRGSSVSALLPFYLQCALKEPSLGFRIHNRKDRLKAQSPFRVDSVMNFKRRISPLKVTV